MIATRPADSTAPLADKTTRPGVAADPRHARFATSLSVALRLLLLACAGVLIEIGWIAVGTLSYRLTHGNEFTFTYLTTQPAVWGKLMDLLTLGNTLVPGMETPGFQGPASLDLVVNPLAMAFVITTMLIAGIFSAWAYPIGIVSLAVPFAMWAWPRRGSPDHERAVHETYTLEAPV